MCIPKIDFEHFSAIELNKPKIFYFIFLLQSQHSLPYNLTKNFHPNYHSFIYHFFVSTAIESVYKNISFLSLCYFPHNWGIVFNYNNIKSHVS